MSVRGTQLEDINKILVLVSDWLNDIEQNIKRDQGEGPFNDLSEKKTALDKFKLFLTDVHQHSEMVSPSFILSSSFPFYLSLSGGGGGFWSVSDSF